MEIAVVGLGYVGLPLAVAFSKKYNVIGFDINQSKIESYKNGIDLTNEVGNELKKSKIQFTSDETELKNADFIVIAVPTPINHFKKLDFFPLESASKIVGKNLKKGCIVVYESTVYPGATEEICIPILEKYSNMKCGIDFKVGYSPERINPGDKIHKVENILKIVSAMDNESLKIISSVYGSIISAGLYEASCIKVAEAAKILENTQRDINIAFINEAAMLFKNLGIDTTEVINAASTKWNFLRFLPGLVGGHCIGVDPYYLIEKANDVGFNAKIMKSAREVNDSISQLISDEIEKKLNEAGIRNVDSNVAVLGLTFKEDVPDIRNSKSLEISKILKEKGINVVISDPLIDLQEENFKTIDEIKDMDAVIFAVAHKEYKSLHPQDIKKMLRDSCNIVYDVKNIFTSQELQNYGLLKISL